MPLRSSKTLPWLAAIWMCIGGGTGTALAADDPCAAIKWNVTEERAVFAQPAQTTAAGRNSASAPTIKTKTLYELTLTAQDGVTFAAPPGKKALPDGAFAGLVHFRVPTTGVYRISLDQGFWVDIVNHQTLIESTDFTGAHDCSAPRKIVQYNLPGGEDLVLQLSGAPKDRVRVAVTSVAATAAGGR